MADKGGSLHPSPYLAGDVSMRAEGAAGSHTTAIVQPKETQCDFPSKTSYNS